jgi:hypothetical protein
LGESWQEVEKRTGQVFTVATIAYNEEPPREYTVEIGLRTRRLRVYKRFDRERWAVRHLLSYERPVLYCKFFILSYARSAF